VVVDKIRSQKFARMVQACWAHVANERPNFDSILCDLEDEAFLEDVKALQREHELLMKRTSRDAILDERQKAEILSRNLMDVMHSGDVEEAARLLAAGAEVNFADYDRRRPLHIAAAEGHVECVKMLLKHGARVLSQDRWGGSSIDDAKQGGHREIVALLLAARDNPGQELPSSSMMTLPIVALGQDNAELAEPRPELTASSAGSLDEVARRRSRMRVSFELMFAVHDHDIEAVRKFVSGNADVNGTDYDLRSPLHIAAAVGDKEIAQLLIQYGANVCAVDKWGLDALTEAQRSGHPDVAEVIERTRTQRQSTSAEQKI
jgi:Ankyrin repeats (3 copies)